MEIAPDVVQTLERHPAVARVEPVGSRAEGRATAYSDYDFIVETTDFAAVAEALPALLVHLEPLAQQWDRLSHEMCWMIMIPGPTKIDFIFPNQAHEQEPPWVVSCDTLPGIDAHFWDWALWLRSKDVKGDVRLVESELRRLHEHLLWPLGVETAPSSVADAVATYRHHREAAERRFGCSVSRALEGAVAPVLG